MAEGRSLAAWNHTSSVWALAANIHRAPGTTARFKLSDFNPHLGGQARLQPVKQVDMQDLRKTFVDGMGIPVHTVNAAEVKVRTRDIG